MLPPSDPNDSDRYTQPSPLYTIRHVIRTNPSTVKVVGIYYVVEGVIYKSPAIRSLMKTNISRTLDSLAGMKLRWCFDFIINHWLLNISYAVNIHCFRYLNMKCLYFVFDRGCKCTQRLCKISSFNRLHLEFWRKRRERNCKWRCRSSCFANEVE